MMEPLSPTPPGGARPLPTLDHSTLVHVFWRSLFILAGFCPRDMQSLGFTYALFPGLEKLHRRPGELEAAVKRHLDQRFNCHPYVAAIILGGTLRHEEGIALGIEPPESSTAFKASLMGPLAAVGDGFFWLSLRPFVGAFGVFLALLAGPLGVLVHLVTYNFVHLHMRARFLSLGYHLGDDVLTDLALRRLPGRGRRLRQAAMACSAAVLTWAVVWGSATFRSAGMGDLGALGASWGAFGITWLLLSRNVSPYALLYAAAILAIILGVWIP